MISVSRLIVGLFGIFLGISLSLIPLFVKENVSFVSLIYGIPILIIGVIILLNKKEDKIEQINSEVRP